MEYSEIMNAISTVGFPIVCCAALFWQMNRQNENHREEMNKITEAVQNNTKALTQLSERIGGHE